MVWYSPLLREDSLTPFPRRSGRSLTSAKVAHRRQRRNHVLVAAPATGRTQPGQACGGMDSETDAPILIPPERPRSPTRPSQSEYRGDDTNGVPIASSCPRCLLQVIAAAPNHRSRLRALAVMRGPRAPVTNSPTSTDSAPAAVRGGAAAPPAGSSTHSPAPSRISQTFPGALAGPAEAASAGAGNECRPVVVGGRDATEAPTISTQSLRRWHVFAIRPRSSGARGTRGRGPVHEAVWLHGPLHAISSAPLAPSSVVFNTTCRGRYQRRCHATGPRCRRNHVSPEAAGTTQPELRVPGLRTDLHSLLGRCRRQPSIAEVRRPALSHLSQ